MPPKGKKRLRRSSSKQAQEEAEVDPREEEEGNDEEESQQRGKAKKTRVRRKQGEAEDEPEPMDVDDDGEEGGESQESGSSSQPAPTSTDELVLRDVEHMLEGAEQDGRRIVGLPSNAPLFPTQQRPSRVHATEDIASSPQPSGPSGRGRRGSAAPPPRRSTGGGGGSNVPEEEGQGQEAHPPSTEEQRRQQQWSKEAHGAIVEASNRRGSKGKGKAAPVAPSPPARQPSSRHTSPTKSPGKALSEAERKARREAAKASAARFAGPYTLLLRLVILLLVGGLILRAWMAPTRPMPPLFYPPSREELERAEAMQREADDAILANFEADLLHAMDRRAAEALQALDKKIMAEASREVEAMQARATQTLQAMQWMAETVDNVALEAQRLGTRVEEGMRRREAQGQEGPGEEEEEEAEFEALRDELDVLTKRMHELRAEAEELGSSGPPPLQTPDAADNSAAGHSKLRRGGAPASPTPAAASSSSVADSTTHTPPPSEAEEEEELRASLEALQASLADGPLASLRHLTSEIIPSLHHHMRELRDLDIEIVAPLPPTQKEEEGEEEGVDVVRLVEEGWAKESGLQRLTVKASRALVQEGLEDEVGSDEEEEEEEEGEEGGWVSELEAQLQEGLDTLREEAKLRQTQALATTAAKDAENVLPPANAENDLQAEDAAPLSLSLLPSAEWVEAKVDQSLRGRLPTLTHAGAAAPDFASARGGAHINRRHGLTSPPLDNRRPEVAISDSFQLGDCYPLPLPGRLTVRLSRAIVPQSFGLSHISSHVALVHGTRPTEVRLYGYPDAAALSEPMPLGDKFMWAGGELHHTFELPLDASRGQPIRAVTLEVLNNTGDLLHTCLYRFRMHGSPLPLPRDNSLACHFKSHVLGEGLECAENEHISRVAQEARRVEALPWVQQLQQRCAPWVQQVQEKCIPFVQQVRERCVPWVQQAKETLTALVQK